MEQLQAAAWKPSRRTDADAECELWYQPRGWGAACRFVALRYENKPAAREAGAPEQYQLFDTPRYSYRVFVTNMDAPIDALAWFYNQRAGAENMIEEANNDADLAEHPSRRWALNCNHFQIAMPAYKLNCWLLLFNREESADATALKHVRLSTARLRFLFLAAKIRRRGGRVGVSYSGHYAEQGIFERLLLRLRAIRLGRRLLCAGGGGRAALLSILCA